MFSASDPLANRKKVRVTLTLRSGVDEAGHLLLPTHKSLSEVLNDDGAFLDMERMDGKRCYLSKAEIARILPEDKPVAKAKVVTAAEIERFEASDPYIVLGHTPGTDLDLLRRSYHELARAYHPDRLASFNLPPELIAIAARVTARLNTAFHELEASMKSAQKVSHG